VPLYSLQSGSQLTTLRQQLLHSHLRVAGIAAIALFIIVLAMQMLRAPIQVIQLSNVPSADAAMTVQLGLQRSEANLRGWVALKNVALRHNVERAWSSEIRPAFQTLQELSKTQHPEQRQSTLESIDEKLNRLKSLQDWTIAVSAKSGNEPARLVFSNEFGPSRKQLASVIDEFRHSQPRHATVAIETLFQLRLSLSEAESALGRFVVEGLESEVSNYEQHIEAIHSNLDSFDITSPIRFEISHQLDILERLSDSIIESRRSPRSNVAWHTIGTRIEPLSAEIASDLAMIADLEVSAMRSHVDDISKWINLLTICSALALVLVLGIALVLSIAQAKRISAPVTELFRATEALKEGNYGAALRPNGVQEVQGLIQAFNAMRDSIASSHNTLEELAYSDELTGLGNRKAFNDSIAAMNSAPSQPNRFSAIMIIDLDYFKQTNDSYGHDAGDLLLSTFASRLQESVRPDDIVSRIGGDEFSVVLKSIANTEEAIQTVDRITKTTSQPINYHGEVILPSATIGIAVESQKDIDVNQLVKKADLALYDAKETGRGGYSVYSKKLHEKTAKVRRLAEIIETSSPDKLFRLVYQPYVELQTGRIVGVEALLRCDHSVCADTPIFDVITILERNGHIAGVSQWVVQEAVNQLEMWRNSVDLPADFTMSINVSISLLREDDFIQSILDIVQASDVPGNALTIELTETTVMEDYARSEQAMAKLNAIGIEFAMDDFGTGYSSLVRLKEMPLSLLKIDQTFVKGMLESPNDAAIVDASVRLGHAIGMSVTAEGIETAEQAAALRELGCDRAQGYYFYYPTPADELDLMAPPLRFAA